MSSTPRLITPRAEAWQIFLREVVAAATALTPATNYFLLRSPVPLRIFGAHVNVRSAIDGSSATSGKFEFRLGTAVNNNTPASTVQQIETATAAGTITGSGNATVVVTGAPLSGSPVTLSVAVLNTDTAATWAGKVRTALAANSAIASTYIVGGTGASITLTRIEREANDATLNISLDNGTCTGITTAATSANTTAGVAPGTNDIPGARMSIAAGNFGSEDTNQGQEGFVLPANTGLWVRCVDIGSTGTPAGLDVSLSVGFA